MQAIIIFIITRGAPVKLETPQFARGLEDTLVPDRVLAWSLLRPASTFPDQLVLLTPVFEALLERRHLGGWATSQDPSQVPPQDLPW